MGKRVSRFVIADAILQSSLCEMDVCSFDGSSYYGR